MGIYGGLKMNKVRVIDLLNKIANGEIETNTGFYYKNEKYRHIDNLFGDYYVEEVLNDEVEIIEEDKKIENLINCVNGVLNGEMSSYYEKTDLQVIVEHNFKVIQEKINEIIDYINKE